MENGTHGTQETMALCKEMAQLCDEYLLIWKSPEGAKKAAEVRENIIRLYLKISTNGGLEQRKNIR